LEQALSRGCTGTADLFHKLLTWVLDAKLEKFVPAMSVIDHVLTMYGNQGCRFVLFSGHWSAFDLGDADAPERLDPRDIAGIH
jgi:hypothetical protein